jgi:hypothetical protein
MSLGAWRGDNLRNGRDRSTPEAKLKKYVWPWHGRWACLQLFLRLHKFRSQHFVLAQNTAINLAKERAILFNRETLIHQNVPHKNLSEKYNLGERSADVVRIAVWSRWQATTGWGPVASREPQEAVSNPSMLCCIAVDKLPTIACDKWGTNIESAIIYSLSIPFPRSPPQNVNKKTIST